jgi:hypothetical protein
VLNAQRGSCREEAQNAGVTLSPDSQSVVLLINHKSILYILTEVN